MSFRWWHGPNMISAVFAMMLHFYLRYKTFALITLVKKNISFSSSRIDPIMPHWVTVNSCAIWCEGYLDTLHFCIVYEIPSCWLYHQCENELVLHLQWIWFLLEAEMRNIYKHLKKYSITISSSLINVKVKIKVELQTSS